MLEGFLQHKEKSGEPYKAMYEYFKSEHAEIVPAADMNKTSGEVLCLPVHSVNKENSSTTKVQVVFDSSVRTSTGVCLNDMLYPVHTQTFKLVTNWFKN